MRGGGEKRERKRMLQKKLFMQTLVGKQGATCGGEGCCMWRGGVLHV